MDDTDPRLYLSAANLVFGLSAFLMGTIITILICANRDLHEKNLILLLGLAGSDALTGFGYFWNSIRFYYYNSFEVRPMVSSKECILHQLILQPMLSGAHCTSLMTTMIAFDRLLATVIPLRYKQMGVGYASICLAAVYGYTLSFIAVLTFFAATHPEIEIPQPCSLAGVVPSTIAVYHECFILSNGCIIVMIYIALVFSMSCCSQDLESNEERKRQIQVTKTVGILVAITTALVTIPAMIRAGVAATGTTPGFALFMVVAFVPLTSFVNVFTYALKYQKIREKFATAFSKFRTQNQISHLSMSWAAKR